MAPSTIFDASVGFQKNIGLDRQNTTAGMAYTWKSSKRVGHRLDLFNLQYINNQNVDNYFQIYESEYDKLEDVSETTGEFLPENTVENYTEILKFNDDFLNDPANEENFPEEYNTVSDVDERHDILIENSFVPVISYSFAYNTRENINDNDFSYFTARFISAGTFTDLVYTNKNEDGQSVLFDVPVAQYFKTELEYKKYWELRSENILVFRTFAGVAIPYGNSENVPFSRSYSAGGSNEMRAWRTFDLGPGAELNNLEYNVATFKLVANLEYRFQLTNKFYSALFVDAGNVWKDEEEVDLDDLNWSAGFGFRLSLTNMPRQPILRIDFGWALGEADNFAITVGHEQHF
jgi:outer membrane protein assembly factor BamA